MPRPLILFISADQEKSDLDALRAEEREIERVLRPADASEKLEFKRYETPDNDAFDEYVRPYLPRLDVFHFAGHARPDALEFQEGIRLRVEALAQFLKVCQDSNGTGLKLAFLNGCSTEPMIDLLLKVGVQAVIGTTSKIGDIAAKDFAICFYKDIASGFSLREAFESAKASVFKDKPALIERVSQVFRDSESDSELNFDAEWLLVVQKKHEQILDWKLVSNVAGMVGMSDEALDLQLRQKRLETSFCKLNYYDQADKFQAVSKENKVAAFVVHGDERNGQAWLAHNILLENYRNNTNSIQFKPLTISKRTKVGDIVAEIKRLLGLERTVGADLKTEAEGIAQELLRRLGTEPVFIIVYNDYNFLGLEQHENARSLLVDFWGNLASKVTEGQPKFHLIFLLVDEFNQFAHAQLCVATPTEGASLPVDLTPVLKEKMPDSLQEWMRAEKREATHPLKDGLFKRLVSPEDIVQYCEGMSYEDFFGEACGEVGFEFVQQNDRSFKIVPLS